jgi:ribonucleotide reductase beta subunit family protein with ferritin-like domain
LDNSIFPNPVPASGSTAIRWDSFPARLYCKGKQLSWEPEAIDFSQDVKDWENITPTQRRMIVQMVAIFAEGEGAVTSHLAPMIICLSKGGYREHELPR